MRVTNLFLSIDGEVNPLGQGIFSTFVRLGGCNLRCLWCDTPHAQAKNSGANMAIEMIFRYIKRVGCGKITITGGEPLLQRKELSLLMRLLKSEKFFTSIETNGSFEIPSTNWMGVDSWIADWKLGSSGMSHAMDVKNLCNLTERDWVKFIIADEDDFHEALEIIPSLRGAGCSALMAFSPCMGRLEPQELFKWVRDKKLFDIRLNIQLHKLIHVA